jgi:arsenate reductase-like glutaredoxin family protein
MKNCENCGKENKENYGSGRFCSDKCARGFSTKNKRTDINKRVSKALTKEPYRFICLECHQEFRTKKKKQIFCSSKCADQYKFKNPLFLKNLSIALSEVYKDPQKRERLKQIGRKGGFGKKGFTNQGTRYESQFEKECFEWLEENKIPFEAHKSIPNSSKVSDIYLAERNLWIELDGINREKRKKWLKKDYQYWLEKLEIYKNNNLIYEIVYNLKEFQQLVR